MKRRARVRKSVASEAIRYAGMGIPVLPLYWARDGVCACEKMGCTSAGKHPLTRHGFKSATTDLDTIRAWWKRWPNANIGLVTGSESGLLVIDVDPRNGGSKTLRALEQEHGKFPETARHTTGGGGAHIFFRVPKHAGSKGRPSTLGPGVDVKADGGYIVAPPSVHVSGRRYEPDSKGGLGSVDLATPPEWLIQRLKSPTTKMAKSSTGHGSAIDSGERNNTLTSIAGSLRRHGLTVEAIRGTLRHVNTESCRPPLEDSEVDAIASSISRYDAYSHQQHLPPGPLQLPDYSVFPYHVFPERLAAFIEQASSAMGCDPTLLAVPILSIAAGALGNACRIALKKSWQEPSVIWIVIVGESGTLKSPALDLVTRPVVARHHDAYAAYKDEYDEWAEQNKQGPRPHMVRDMASDTTIEALADILHVNSRGLLLVRDELSGWLNAFNAYKHGQGGDEAHWLEMHGARPLTVDRKTGENRLIVVRRAAVSICGGIQPRILAKCLTTDRLESGLAARLLMAMPPRKAKRWNSADVDESAIASYSRLMSRLYEIKPAGSDCADYTPRDLPLSARARVIWAEFFDEHNREQVELTDELAAVWSKLEGYAARLALVVQHLNWAFATKKEAFPEEVSEASIRAGIAMSRWFGNEARRIYGTIAEPVESADQRRIIELARRSNGRTTLRSLRRASSRFEDEQYVRRLLDGLDAAGYGRWQERPSTEKGGRPTKEFVLSETDKHHVSQNVSVRKRVRRRPRKARQD